MKVWIDADEWYPVYSIRTEGDGFEVDATEEQASRWEQAKAEFEAAQTEMDSLYSAASQADLERREEEKAARLAAELAERERVRSEREREAAEQQRRQDDMWRRIRQSGGFVYDASGHCIGTVNPDRKIVP